MQTIVQLWSNSRINKLKQNSLELHQNSLQLHFALPTTNLTQLHHCINPTESGVSTIMGATLKRIS